MSLCEKCGKITAILILAAGVSMLLKDLGIWTFWNISGWTLLFLILGVVGFAASQCFDCGSCCKSDGKKKKK